MINSFALKLAKSTFIYKNMAMLRNILPNGMFHTKDYYFVKMLLTKKEEGQDIEEELRGRLVSVLSDALNNVPYYRNLKLNICADDINCSNVYEALKEFPFLDKKTLMQNPKSFISLKHINKSIFYLSSGGSTGIGAKVWTNYKELQIEKAFFDFYWGKAGYNSNSKILKINNFAEKANGTKCCIRLGNILSVSPWHLNDNFIKSIYSEIIDFRPLFIHAYPSCIEYVVQYMNKNNLKIDFVKAIFLGSEKIEKTLCDSVVQNFQGTKVLFHYGLTEKSNLAWGICGEDSIKYKCENVYSFYENYVDKYERYEIVGTSLWNNVMPLIRYRTKDFGRINENGIIDSLDGREQEFLITKDNSRIPGFSIDVEDDIWNFVEAYQIIQNEPGKIEYHIKPKDIYYNKISSHILEVQNKKWGNIFEISLFIDKDISRTKTGKKRFIINNLKYEG